MPATQVRERPILFSGPMVRAILDGQKSQTRRVLTPQPDGSLDHSPRLVTRFQNTGVEIKTGKQVWGACSLGHPVNAFREGRDSITDEIRCPYGAPGDHLWVRETWGESARGQTLYFASPEQIADIARAEGGWVSQPRKRPSIHMSRWASRLTLEITNVRVERLQEISTDDAMAEGIFGATKDGTLVKWGRDGLPWTDWGRTPQLGFAAAWNTLNEKRGFGWNANPWVWVIEFKRVTP